MRIRRSAAIPSHQTGHQPQPTGETWSPFRVQLTVLHIALHRRNETLWRAFLERDGVDKTIQSEKGVFFAFFGLHFTSHATAE
jgi:hypothetical protein